QFAHVSDRENSNIEAGFRQLADGDLDDGRLADRHEGFRQGEGIGPQPRPLPAGENYCPSASCRFCRHGKSAQREAPIMTSAAFAIPENRSALSPERTRLDP